MFWRDEAATVVALLGPWIRVEEKRTGNAFLGQHIEHIAGITGVNRYILRPGIADFAQEHGNTVYIGLAPDEPHIGVLHGLMHHVFTTAEPDFEPDISIPEKGF